MLWQEAAEHLAVIRAQVARSERGVTFRAAPIAATGALAAGLGGFHALLEAPADARAFATHWLTLAGVAALLCALDVLVRLVRGTRDERRRFGFALGQLLPAFFVGAVLSAEALRRGELALLPALWSALFGLALLAAKTWLPLGLQSVSHLYLAGAGVLLLASEASLATQSAILGAMFGLGQIGGALVLRRHALSSSGGSR